MDNKEVVRNNFTEAAEAIKAFVEEERNIEKISLAAGIIAEAIKKGNKIISCGNGGSMCDAMHFAEELSGRFRNDRKPLPALAISDPSYITCTVNDYGYEQVFSRFIAAMGNKGDVLLAISTSGNSVNVINAVNAAKEKGMHVVGLTGKNGGKMASLCEVEIRAPYSEFSDRAQEIHIKVIHSLIQIIETLVCSIE